MRKIRLWHPRYMCMYLKFCSGFDQSRKLNTVEVLLTDTLVSGQLYLRPPWQNPFLPGSHTNFVYTHSGKRPAPVTDTISAFRECPPTGASTVTWWIQVQSFSFSYSTLSYLKLPTFFNFWFKIQTCPFRGWSSGSFRSNRKWRRNTDWLASTQKRHRLGKSS